MARKPIDYWEERSTELMKRLERGTENTIDSLIKAYEQATKDINKEITRIYKNYSKDSELTEATLKQLLNKKETDIHYKNLLNVINNNIKNEDIKKRMLTKYNAAAYSYRISRYEELQQNIDLELKKLANIEQQITEIRYVDTIRESYYHNIFDIQKGTGLGFNFTQIDNKTINLLLNENWINKSNFSKRIWQNSEKLGSYLRTQLTAASMSGKLINKISQELANYMNVGLYNATRLVRTEVNHFANEAEMLSYDELDIDKYKFIATLDNRTCEHCAELDNKVFKVKDRKPGKNCPPIHSNDRCTTVAVFDDEVTEELQRRARDENGMPILVSQNMTYQQWYEKNVTNHTKNDIITSDNLLDKLSIKIEDYKAFGKIDPYNNNIQEKVSKILNYDDLPQLLNNEQYSNTNGKEIVRVVHSYHGKTAKEAYENTIKGPIQYSESTNSSYGRGIYFGEKSNEEELLSLFGKKDSHIIKAKISNTAKIVEFEKQFDYLKDVEERLKKVPKELRDFYKNERSLLYMLDGIDGIKIKSKGYYCIYNRRVLKVNV